MRGGLTQRKNGNAVAVVGDCHGHLQLALCALALWQQREGFHFDAVFLCGDVGTFTDEAQLDNATRRHAKRNPCELEFMTQWSSEPPAPWLRRIFEPVAEGGLGLVCPVVMVHGNHEGFAHLAPLVPAGFPEQPVALTELPAIEPSGRIRLLPSGWLAVTASGLVVVGVGGIERGQRTAAYHPMAYIDDAAVARLLDADQPDILVTHQGPTSIQGEHGSETLQLLLDHRAPAVWCHGHSTPHPNPVSAGPAGRTRVVPLGGIAFSGRGPNRYAPGADGWAMIARVGEELVVDKRAPPGLRELRQHRWSRTPDGLLVCPALAGTA